MSHYVSNELRQHVYKRAMGCCEYCLIHDEDHYLPHEVDHIISIKHRGTTDPENLCLSCFDCNRYKGSDIGSYDLDSNTFVSLFNPRTMVWSEHFQMGAGGYLHPISAHGRVTAFLLRLNSENRLLRRAALIQQSRYPP